MIGMTNHLVYAITLNWNRKDDTLACLESLARQTLDGIRVLVVDNHSTDGSPNEISKCFPQIEQIVNSENLGFAAGFNIGLRFALVAKADYLLILNNDTILSADCVERLMQAITSEAGILAPLIYYANQPQRIWALGGSAHPLLLEKHDPWAGMIDPGNLPEILDCDFVTGCAMFFPRKVLETVGLFDERFRMYYEDSDLCLRVRQAGLRIQAVSTARMWHKVASSSGGSDSPTERYWMARSSIRYFQKHARSLQIPAVAFWRTGSALRTTVHLARSHKWTALSAYWRGLRDGLADTLAGVKKP
jgi:GT2 family glycosyltransferase